MFGTRISFPFSRIFRLRRRRPAKANDVARASYYEPHPPSNSRRPISLKPEPINTTSTPSPRRRSIFSSLQSPVAQSSFPTSPGPAATSLPIIIIGQDPPESTPPLPPAPAPPRDVGPHAPADGVSLLESPPAPTTRRVSFQLPTTHAEEQDRPSTPLSTCSTLVTEVGAHVEGEIVLDAGSVWASPEGDDPVAELPSAVRSESARAARHRSLFTPQPVRVDLTRFSLPVSPTTPNVAASTNTSYNRRESKRTSTLAPASGSGSTKKEKRTTRWSRELNKPETQEVLRVLRGL